MSELRDDPPFGHLSDDDLQAALAKAESSWLLRWEELDRALEDARKLKEALRDEAGRRAALRDEVDLRKVVRWQLKPQTQPS